MSRDEPAERMWDWDHKRLVMSLWMCTSKFGVGQCGTVGRSVGSTQAENFLKF